MGRDSGAWDFLDEKTGTDTGFSSDGGMVRLYDPASGKYVWRATKGEPLAYNPRNGKTKYMYTEDGKRVLGYDPGDDFNLYMDPDLEGLRVGYTPDPYNVPDRNGMADDGFQRRGRTVTPDPATMPDPDRTPTGAGPGYGGGGTRDPIKINWGAPDQGTVDPGVEIGEVDPFDPQGFGMSTNEDFYAQQSANQRAQLFRNALREGVARNNRKEAAERAPEAFDPWSWVDGGAESFEVEPSTGNTRVEGEPEWMPNSRRSWTPGETTNAELIQMYSDMPFMKGMDTARWIKEQGDNNEWGTWDPNNGNPNPFLGRNDYIDQMFKNMWTSEAMAEPGVPSVPAGYASPLG